MLEGWEGSIAAGLPHSPLIHSEEWKTWRKRQTGPTVEKIPGEELDAPLNKEIDAPD